MSTTPSPNSPRLDVNQRQSSSVTQALQALNGHRPRRCGRPALAHRRHLASVCRLWPRSSVLEACMTSTMTPSSAWMQPFPPSRLSRAESSAAAESPSRAHSGELERAPRCIASHQSSLTAPPCAALQLPPSSSP